MSRIPISGISLAAVLLAAGVMAGCQSIAAGSAEATICSLKLPFLYSRNDTAYSRYQAQVLNAQFVETGCPPNTVPEPAATPPPT